MNDARPFVSLLQLGERISWCILTFAAGEGNIYERLLFTFGEKACGVYPLFWLGEIVGVLLPLRAST